MAGEKKNFARKIVFGLQISSIGTSVSPFGYLYPDAHYISTLDNDENADIIVSSIYTIHEESELADDLDSTNDHIIESTVPTIDESSKMYSRTANTFKEIHSKFHAEWSI